MSTEKSNLCFCLQRDGQITDFLSFYTLPSTVMHHPVHKSLKAAYAFYNVSTKTPWADLMQDALIIAKNVSVLFTISPITTCEVSLLLIMFVYCLSSLFSTDH